jgi:hypothetical protein
MTNKQINELFAERIWGWHKKEWFTDPKILWWYDSESMRISVEDYTPSTKFLQAFEALEKFCVDKGYEYSIKKIIHPISKEIEHECHIHVWNSHYNPDKSAAICGALIQALEAK